VKFMQSVRSPAVGLLALAAVCAGPASAQQVKAGDLAIDHAWTRATPAGATVGAGYLTIENKGATADRLMGVATAVAARAEVHEMTMNNGVMMMRPVQGGLSIPPGQSVALAPGGYHIMMMGLKAPLKEGGKIALTLEFEKAGRVDVALDVQGLGAQQPGGMPMPSDGGHMNKM
jgi:hypothetical protein